MSATPQVLIVDDHWISAAGLASLVTTATPGVPTVICQSVAEAVRWVGSHGDSPLLVVADFWLPDGTALTLLELLQGRPFPVKTIVLSGDDNPELMRKVLDAGAWDFRSKARSAAEFLQLIQEALSDAPVPRISEDGQATGDIDADRGRSTPLLKMTPEELGLTRRQGEILHHVLAGSPNKIIARALGIGEQTVKEHVSVLLNHFQAANRIALIRHFADRRLTIQPVGRPSASSP